MHVIDISIIISFLIATLYVGLKSGKNIKTFSDYAIGDRKFSDFAIFCTVAATAIGGTTVLGHVGKTYTLGIIHLLGQWGPLTYFIIGCFFVYRFGNYYGCYSIGDVFYKSYGMPGKLLAGIIGSLYTILGVGLNLLAMGTAISVLTGLSYCNAVYRF